MSQFPLFNGPGGRRDCIRVGGTATVNQTQRILLVGRRFWPSAAFDSSGYLAQMATDLHRSGCTIEVLTPRYAASWPERVFYRELVVHRPAAAPRSDWSLGRYIRHLTTWLKPRVESFDTIFCDAIREEALAVVESTANSSTSTVLMSSGYGSESDPVWWQSSRAARRCAAAANSADSIIAKDVQTERLLLSNGLDANKIRRIPIGFTSAIGFGPRDAARRRLGFINSDLQTLIDTPVIVCCGRMLRDGGMELLAKSARYLIARYSDLRIWFIGDGPNRQAMYDFLRSEGVRNSISMPGTFTDLADVFAAADVYVQGDESGLDYTMPAAVSASLPIVAIDTQAVRGVLGLSRSEGQTIPNLASLFPAATDKSLRGGLRDVLDDLPAARARAAELKRYLLRTRPQSHVIENYLDLFHQLKRSTPFSSAPQQPSGSSIETAS